MGDDILAEGQKIAVSNDEVFRRYRLTKQAVAMHYAYSARANLYARVAELVLVAASVVFLVTTFADDNLYEVLGLDARISRVVLGIASALAFFGSMALLIVDWAGTAALHRAAGEKFGELLMKFRQSRLDDKTWPDEIADQLCEGYEVASSNSVSIPDKKFNSLKAQYLTKKEVSALASRHPGAPLFVLRLIVRLRASRSALTESWD